jgi:hypothetical protein
VIGIYEVLPRAHAALAPVADTDPQVIGLTDAVVAPCLQISWAQPWLLPEGQAPAFYARVQVLLIGGRVEGEGALDELEDLATYTIRHLALDPAPWVALEAGAPRGMTFGGVDYLAARLVYQIAVDGTKEREPGLEAVQRAG